jgi:hypothetical protein
MKPPVASEDLVKWLTTLSLTDRVRAVALIYSRLTGALFRLLGLANLAMSGIVILQQLTLPTLDSQNWPWTLMTQQLSLSERMKMQPFESVWCISFTP